MTTRRRKAPRTLAPVISLAEFARKRWNIQPPPPPPMAIIFDLSPRLPKCHVQSVARARAAKLAAMSDIARWTLESFERTRDSMHMKSLGIDPA